MKKAFILLGNFGVGKSAITTFYPHTSIEGSDPFTEVNHVLSLGGERGADTLNSGGWNKEKVYTELIPRYVDRDLLIHSVFYHGVQDVNRLMATHKVVVFYLRTPYETNAKRIAKRGDGKKINDKAFISFIKMAERVRQFCAFSKAKFYRIDNDRPLKTVASEIWEIIDRECGRWEVGDNFSPSKTDEILAETE